MAESKQSTSGTSTSQPGWAPQANALTQLFGQVPGAVQTAQGVNLPSNFTATMTPDQLAVYKNMMTTGSGVAGNGVNLSNTGTDASGAGATAAEGALTSLGGFNPASTNNPSNVINAATEYMNGQNIPSQVAQAMVGANQEARDVTLPGINQTMTDSGNQNSSRNAIAQGLVQRGLAENAQNMTSSMEGQAFQGGLGLAENQNATNNSALLAALTGAAGAGTGLTTAGSLAGTEGVNNLVNSLGLASTGAGGVQQNTQEELTNELQQYMYGSQAPFLPLNEAMGIVGTQNWGPTTNSNATTTTTPSALQLIAGGMTGVGGMLNGIGNVTPSNFNLFNPMSWMG